jgi:dCMP deaminase
MVLPWFPCMPCARAIIQAGIVELVATKPNFADPKWGEDFIGATEMFAETGVAVRYYCEAA